MKLDNFIFEENSNLIHKAYKKAEKALTADAIDVNEFVEPYGLQQIEDDQRKARELKKN